METFLFPIRAKNMNRTQKEFYSGSFRKGLFDFDETRPQTDLITSQSRLCRVKWKVCKFVHWGKFSRPRLLTRHFTKKVNIIFLRVVTYYGNFCKLFGFVRWKFRLNKKEEFISTLPTYLPTSIYFPTCYPNCVFSTIW